MRNSLLTWCIILTLPLVLGAAEVSEEAEVRAVTKTVDDLVTKWDAGELNEELFSEMAYAVINKGLGRYPQSVELLNASDYLAIIQARDQVERKEARDSLRARYKKLLDENPESPVYAYKYAWLLDDPAEKVNYGEELTKKYPDFYWGCYLLGTALEDQGKTAAAIKAYDKAVEIDSTKYALASLARLYYDVMQFKKSYEAATAAYERNPDYSYAYDLACKSAEAAKDNELMVDLNRTAVGLAARENEEVFGDLIRKIDNLWKAFASSGESDSARFYMELGYAFSGLIGGETEQNYTISMADFETGHGNPDAALDYLEKLVEKGFSDYLMLLDSEGLKSLEGQPRFDSLVSDMKRLRLAERINEPAPDFTLATLGGDSVSLSDLRGKPVMIDFWGLGCGPCHEALPYLKGFYQKHAGELQVISVEVWGSDQVAIKKYVDENGITCPVLIGSMELAKVYGFRGVPSFFFIDAHGNVAFKRSGFAPVVAGEWELFLQTLLED